MSTSAPPPVTVVDMLTWGPERRESVEAAIRAALERVPGGPWLVTLRPPAFPATAVSVFVRTPHSVLVTSFPPDATEDEIRARLSRGAQAS
jgi:hypothetical protein